MTPEHRMEIAPSLHPVLGLAFVNFIFVIILLIIFFSFFAAPSGFEIRLPAAGDSSALDESHATVRITSENVLYFNDKVMTINELKRALFKINTANKVIYLRVDRRASVGRVADVWDLCKGLAIARVKMVASQE